MTDTDQKDRVFDFRMDVSSWITIVSMILIFAFMFIPETSGLTGGDGGPVKNLLLGLVITFFLISIACIPVIIYCWFVKVIPDIDYSVIVAAFITIIAMVSYLI